MRTIDIIVDDPSPERLWTVVHCSEATAWIKRTSIQRIQCDSGVEYISKDCLIEIDLDSGKRTELETFDGELAYITFTDDFIYAILESKEDGSPCALVRICQSTKVNEILWRFEPEDKSICLWDVFHNEYILFDAWSGREEDDEQLELLSLPSRRRTNICTKNLPYFICFEGGIRILVDSGIDPSRKLAALGVCASNQAKFGVNERG